MSEIRFDIGTNADESERVFGASVERIVGHAERLEKAMARADRSLQLGSSGARNDTASTAANAQVAQIERVTAAQRQQATAIGATTASLAQEEAAKRRAISAGLTALSTLGNEGRAYSQLTNFQIRHAKALREEIDLDRVLAGVQGELARRHGEAASAFSLSSIRSKDLRLNMLGLNQAVTALSSQFGTFGPTVLRLFSGISGAISGAREEMAKFAAASRAAQAAASIAAGGAVAGGAPLGAAETAAAAGAGAAAPKLATRALAAVGGPAGVVSIATIAGTTAAFAKLVSVADELEVAFDEVSAITGITGADLNRLTETSIRMAAEMGQSTTDIAQAFKLVASSSPELIGVAGALEGVTTAAILLSKASGDDLRTSVTALTTTLAQFGLGAGEAGRVIDVLAAGSKIGAIEVGPLGEALARTGAVARGAGVELEELVAVIETVGKSKQPLDSIEVSVRNLILRLQTSGRLTQGESLLGALQDLSKEGLSTAELLKLLGERTITTGQFLLQNLDVLERYNEGVKETGLAALQGATRTDNLSGAAKRASTAFGALIDSTALTTPVVVATDAFKGLAESLQEVFENATKANLGIVNVADLGEVERRIDEIRNAQAAPTVARGTNLEEQRRAQELELLQLAQDRRQILEQMRAEEEELLGGGIGFGVRRTGDEQDLLIAESIANVRGLRTEFDSAAAAQAKFEDATDRINAEMQIFITTSGQAGISAAEGARLTDLARAATIEKSAAYKSDAKSVAEAERAQAAWNETIRKSALAAQEGIAASEERIANIERENEILERQIVVASQGPGAIAALTAELRIEKAVLEEMQDVPGPVSPERLQQIEDAIRAHEQLNVTLDTATDAYRKAGQQSEAAARAFQAPWIHAAEGIQDALVSGIGSALDELIPKSEGIAGDIVEVFKRAFSELLVVNLFGPQLSGVAGAQGGGSQLSGNGLLGGLLSGIGGLFGGTSGGTSGNTLQGATFRQVSDEEFYAGVTLAARQGTEKGTRSGIGALKDLLGSASLGGVGFGGGGFGGGGGGGSGLLGGIGTLLGGAGYGLGAGLLASSLGANDNLSAIVGVLGAGLIPSVLEAATLGAQLLIAGYTTGGVAGAAAAAGTAGSLSSGVIASASVPVVGWIAAGILAAVQGIPAGVKLASATSNPVAGKSPWIAGRETAFSTYSLSAAITAATVATFDNDLPRFGLGFTNLAPSSTSKTGISASGPFGDIGFEGGHRASPQQGLDFVSSIAAFDRAIAAALNPEEIDKVTAQLAKNEGQQSFLDSTRHRGKYITEGFDDIFANRVEQIFTAIEGTGFGKAFTARAEPLHSDQFAPLMQEFLQARAEFGATIRQLSGEEIPQFEVALGHLNQAFVESRGKFEPYGLEIQKLTDALEVGRQKLGTDFSDALELRQLSRTDPLAALLLAQQKDTERLLAEARFLDAELGLNTLVAAEREAAADRLAILEEFSERANAPLKSLLSQLTVGDLGGLSIPARFAEAESARNRERDEAFAKPSDPTERAEFAAAEQVLLELAREMYASGQGFQDARIRALADLNALLATPLSGGPVAVAADVGGNLAADRGVPGGESFVVFDPDTAAALQRQVDAALAGNVLQTDTVAALHALREQIVAAPADISTSTLQEAQIAAGNGVGADLRTVIEGLGPFDLTLPPGLATDALQQAQLEAVIASHAALEVLVAREPVPATPVEVEFPAGSATAGLQEAQLAATRAGNASLASLVAWEPVAAPVAPLQSGLVDRPMTPIEPASNPLTFVVPGPASEAPVLRELAPNPATSVLQEAQLGALLAGNAALVLLEGISRTDGPAEGQTDPSTAALQQQHLQATLAGNATLAEMLGAVVHLADVTPGLPLRPEPDISRERFSSVRDLRVERAPLALTLLPPLDLTRWERQIAALDLGRTELERAPLLATGGPVAVAVDASTATLQQAQLVALTDGFAGLSRVFDLSRPTVAEGFDTTSIVREPQGLFPTLTPGGPVAEAGDFGVANLTVPRNESFILFGPEQKAIEEKQVSVSQEIAAASQQTATDVREVKDELEKTNAKLDSLLKAFDALRSDLARQSA